MISFLLNARQTYKKKAKQSRNPTAESLLLFEETGIFCALVERALSSHAVVRLMHRMAKHVRYYDIQGTMGREYLHPGGKAATERLISRIAPAKAPALAVEIGCGLGRTAGVLIEKYRCNYVGLDASPVMLEKAKERLSGFDGKVQLVRCDLTRAYVPVSSSVADLVIAESVLALLDPAVIIGECRRILRHGGILAWNDRLWGAETPAAERKRVNLSIKKMYGFHAAPENPGTGEEWKRFVEQAGFRLLVAERLAREGNHVAPWFRKVRKGLLMLGNPRGLISACRDWVISMQYGGIWESMENWIFVAQKL